MFHTDLELCLEIIDVPIQLCNCTIDTVTTVEFGTCSVYGRQFPSPVLMNWRQGLGIPEKLIESLSIML